MSSCPLLCCHGVSSTGTGIHPGFGERCTAGADGPGIETSESNSSCQNLLPSCLCPKGSAGLQPSTQHWQNSGEEEQEHDKPLKEMRRKGLRAVKRETSTRNQDKEGRERRWAHSWRSLSSGRRKMSPGFQSSICLFSVVVHLSQAVPKLRT